MARGEEPKKSVDGITIVPTSSKDFLRAWLEVMRPLHGLTQKEMDFTAVLLQFRYDIAKKVSDPSMIDTILFSKEKKDEIAAAAGISLSYMKMFMKRLRANGIIEGKKIAPKYLPDWVPGKPFKWLFVFQNEL